MDQEGSEESKKVCNEESQKSHPRHKGRRDQEVDGFSSLYKQFDFEVFVFQKHFDPNDIARPTMDCLKACSEP